MNILTGISWTLIVLASGITVAFGAVRASFTSHRGGVAVPTRVSQPLTQRLVSTDPAAEETPQTRGVDMLSVLKHLLPEKGKTPTQQLHDYVRGEIEHHSHGLATANGLRERGARFAADSDLTREYLRHARKVVELHKIAGVDRTLGSRFLDLLLHVDDWYDRRRRALLKGASGSPQDAPMSWLAHLWAKVTRSLYKGPCQVLCQHHLESLRHAQGMLPVAEYYLAEGLDDQAREVLRSERERHLQLSFRPGEKVETF